MKYLPQGLCRSPRETSVLVQGTRDAACTYRIQFFTQQDAVLTTVCPNGTVNTPLAKDDSMTATLSMANGFSYSLEEPVEGGTYVLDITLNNPDSALNVAPD